MKILKWFFGISALYGVVSMVRAKREDPEKYAEVTEKLEESCGCKWTKTLLYCYFALTYGMTWVSEIALKVGGYLIGFADIFCYKIKTYRKQRGENAYEDN